MSVDMSILIPIIVLQLLLQAVAIVDLVKRDASLIKGGNKLVWGIVILLFSALGPIIYFVMGRKQA